MSKYPPQFEGFIRTHWRGWFMGQISALDDTSPNDASKTPEGRKKLEDLLTLYDSMNAGMGSGSSFQVNPDSGWVRWRLALPGGASEEDGARLFAEEERIFRGDDTVAAMMLNHPKTAGVNLAGPDTCNVCLKQGKTMLCGKCKYRRFCSSECQKRDWPDHKRYCCVGGGGGANRRQKEKEDKKQSLSTQWTKLKAHVTREHQLYVQAILGGAANPPAVDQGAWPHCKRPMWRELLQAAVDRGVLQPGVVAADAAGAVSCAELSSLGVTTETTRALLELKLSLISEVGRTQEQIAYSKALRSLQTTAMQAFDGKLHPDEYLKLTQRPVGLDVAFCAVMMNKNGQKEMYVNVVWHEYGRHSDDIQTTYMKAPILSHTKPPLSELLQAIHVSITAPTGSLFGTDVPHRPTTLRLVRRWGEDYFHAVRFMLLKAEIQCLFTSLEETLEECAEAGTDPDGNNFFF